MDLINDLLVILDINYWGDNLEEIYDNCLFGFLKKDLFKKIFIKGKKDLFVILFLNYYVCLNLKCRRLFDIRDRFDMNFYFEKGLICFRCNKKVYFLRFIVFCENENYLDDFLWYWWVYKRLYISCRGEL